MESAAISKLRALKRLLNVAYKPNRDEDLAVFGAVLWGVREDPMSPIGGKVLVASAENALI